MHLFLFAERTVAERTVFKRPGIREYLERSLEELPQDHFDFPTGTRKATDINYMERIINRSRNEQLQKYYDRQEKYPKILKGADFTATHTIAKGGYGEVVLAKYRRDREGEEDKYVLKINLKEERYVDEDVLFEYMFHEQAHRALKDSSCTVPEPIGIFRKKQEKPYCYIIVSRFIPIYPGTVNTLTLGDAAEYHYRKPLISLKDWRNICLSLITAFETLQAIDIYHNDVKDNNVLVRCYENHVEPVIIDFGLATRSISHYQRINDDGSISYYRKRPKEVYEEERPYYCPILFHQKDPLPTSDLHGVAYMIRTVSSCVKFPIVKEVVTEYRKAEPAEREDAQSLFQKVSDAFDGELGDGTYIEFREDSDRFSVKVAEGKLKYCMYK